MNEIVQRIYQRIVDGNHEQVQAAVVAAAETVEVKTGWNLVGSAGGPVPVGSILTDPPEMTTDGFFSYDGGYARAATIEPATGPWTKVNRDGRLILTAGGPAESRLPFLVKP